MDQPADQNRADESGPPVHVPQDTFLEGKFVQGMRKPRDTWVTHKDINDCPADVVFVLSKMSEDTFLLRETALPSLPTFSSSQICRRRAKRPMSGPADCKGEAPRPPCSSSARCRSSSSRFWRSSPPWPKKKSRESSIEMSSFDQ